MPWLKISICQFRISEKLGSRVEIQLEELILIYNGQFLIRREGPYQLRIHTFGMQQFAQYGSVWNTEPIYGTGRAG